MSSGIFKSGIKTYHHISGEIKIPYLGEVGTEEFLQKLTTQITEMVSAKITQGKRTLFLILILLCKL